MQNSKCSPPQTFESTFWKQLQVSPTNPNLKLFETKKKKKKWFISAFGFLTFAFANMFVLVFHFFSVLEFWIASSFNSFLTRIESAFCIYILHLHRICIHAFSELTRFPRGFELWIWSLKNVDSSSRASDTTIDSFLNDRQNDRQFLKRSTKRSTLLETIESPTVKRSTHDR